jgi:hypothetical protein
MISDTSWIDEVDDAPSISAQVQLKSSAALRF